jgi:hypothetical protein
MKKIAQVILALFVLQISFTANAASKANKVSRKPSSVPVAIGGNIGCEYLETYNEAISKGARELEVDIGYGVPKKLMFKFPVRVLNTVTKEKNVLVCFAQ